MKTDPHPEREAARIVASALRDDASAQEAGDLEAIGERYDDVYAEVLVLCDELPNDVGRSFTFWDSWGDARNHEWMYHRPIRRDDWPRLARHVADAIEAGVPFSDPLLVSYFDELTRPGLLARLGRLLGLWRA